jgi:glutathione S-transferase
LFLVFFRALCETFASFAAGSPASAQRRLPRRPARPHGRTARKEHQSPGFFASMAAVAATTIAPPQEKLMLKLYIGNKNYSSWSMRPWVLLKQAGIPFEEVMCRFDSFDKDSAFKATVGKVSPVGRVPVLVDDGLAVWDTLAIAEYVAEKFPEKHLWPKDVKARARARSVCAEMHSGFTALRTHCPMNIEACLPNNGALVWRDQPGVRADVQRIVSMWTQLLEEHKGPMLFGEFSIADAYFAPVCMRLKNYALPVPGHITDYIRRFSALSGAKAWIEDALAEKDFVEMDEPYRTSR